MMNLSENMWQVGSIFVGLVFFVTGWAKLVEPGRFIAHFYRLMLIKTANSIIGLCLVLFFIALECTLGGALILGLFPQWILPGTIALLVVLTALTYWSTSSGRVEHCGCYSGLMEITPLQSLLFNSFYIILLILAWQFQQDYTSYNTSLNFRSSLILGSLLALHLLFTGLSYLYWQTYNKPLIDLSPLKVNQPWRSSWLLDESQNEQYEFNKGLKIIVFISANCIYCKRWLEELTPIQEQENGLDVIALMTGTEEQRDQLARQLLVNFPILAIKPQVLDRLTYIFPVGIILHNGIIQKKLSGQLSLNP